LHKSYCMLKPKMPDSMPKKDAQIYLNRVVLWMVLVVLLVASHGCTFFAPRPKNILRTVLYTAPRADAVQSKKFSCTMDRVTATTASDANRVQLLTNGKETFPAMLAAIDNAKKCISLDMYKIRMDRVGTCFYRALIRAARRGVRVRYIYDAYGSRSVTYNDFAELIDAGGEVCVFNPVLWLTFVRVNNRNHHKILVVDGRIAFLGGLNLAEEYDGDGQNGWRDTAIMIEGQAAHDAEQIFNESWLQGGMGFIGKDLPVVGINHLKRPIDSPLVKLLDLDGELCHSECYPPTGGTARVRIVPSDPHSLSSTIADQYLLVINSARKSIDITCAYFVPPLVLRRALVNAAKRGVRVRLILPGTTDVPLVRTISVGYYGGLLKYGVEIYEWTRSVLHAKTMVVDGIWSTIGSANLDGRALFLSYEANAAVMDRPLAVAMEEQFERDLRHCRRVTLREWKQRPFLQRVVKILVMPFVGQF
jgi:cardiolipin synthase